MATRNTRASRDAMLAASKLQGETGAPIQDTTPTIDVVPVTDATPVPPVPTNDTASPSADTLAIWDKAFKDTTALENKLAYSKQALSCAIVRFWTVDRNKTADWAITIGRDRVRLSAFRVENVELFLLRGDKRPPTTAPKGSPTYLRLITEDAYAEWHKLEQRVDAASDLALPIIASGGTIEHWDATNSRWLLPARMFCDNLQTPADKAAERYAMTARNSDKTSMPVTVRGSDGNILCGADGKPILYPVKTDAGSFEKSVQWRMRQSGAWMGAAQNAATPTTPINQRAPHHNVVNAVANATDNALRQGNATQDVATPVTTTPASHTTQAQATPATPVTQATPTQSVSTETSDTPVTQTQIKVPVSPAIELANAMGASLARLLNELGIVTGKAADKVSPDKWNELTRAVGSPGRVAMFGLLNVLTAWKANLDANVNAGKSPLGETKAATDKATDAKAVA